MTSILGGDEICVMTKRQELVEIIQDPLKRVLLVFSFGFFWTDNCSPLPVVKQKMLRTIVCDRLQKTAEWLKQRHQKLLCYAVAAVLDHDLVMPPISRTCIFR